MNARESIRFGILGPVEVLVDGEPRPVGGARQKALLATLLLHAGEVVSGGRLIEALWGEDAPATAAKTLQAHVSRLRKDLSLGEGGVGDGVRLLTQPPGYVLHVDPDRLDLARFEALAAEGRRALDAGDAATAAGTLREALALWRGPALADLVLEPVAAVEAPRLEERRLAVLEDRVDADLECGRAAELVAELARLVEQHPLRERLRAQQMLALYRAGRQADALSAYQEARRTLVGELGIEPGPRLRELERRILAQDPILLPEPPRPRTAPAKPPRRRRARLLGGAAALAALAGVGALTFDHNDDEPARKRAQTPRITGNTLVRIDARTGAAKVVAQVGRDPGALLVIDDVAWVASMDRTVSRVELKSGHTERIRGLPGVDRLATTPLGGVFVSSFDRFVWFIDERTLLPRKVVTVKGHAEALAVGAGSLWVASPAGERGEGADQVLRVEGEPAKVAQRVDVGATPLFITYAFGRLWVSNYDGDTLSVVEAGKRAAREIPVGDGPLGIAAGQGAIWVVHFGEEELWRINPVTTEITARIPVGAGPLSVAVGGGWVWVTNREDGTVQQIDPRTNRARRTVDVRLAPFEVVADDAAAYVTIRSSPF